MHELLALIDEREQILARLRSILIDELMVDARPEELDPDAPLFLAGLGLDSLDAVELVYFVQDAFGLPDSPVGKADLRAMRTLNTLVDRVLETRRTP